MRVQTVSRAQILQDLGLRCQSLAANDNRGFRQEFEELEEVGKDLPARVGDSGVNREKNRYPYILPYDHCRVRLSVQNGQPHTDYINANFVPGGESERDFICTQGPLHNTVADFWRMVWEQNVRIVVMVTALRQKDQVMCDKYWPLDRGTVHHGLIQVTTVTRKQGPDYFITTINLRQRACPTDRIITHYHYPVWPDRGIPKDVSSLVAFTELVRQELEAPPRLGPAVVHCRCRPLGHICDGAVAHAAVCSGHPAGHPGRGGGSEAPSDVDGPEPGAVPLSSPVSAALAPRRWRLGTAAGSGSHFKY
ncbi:receptor-type tyrosine-protein phosphatase V-like isoform X6 [Cyclopterus lumpus]|uniref:receptor-type tyrosine-protein phosphatase V-like isoform X6 n=1 Tax=Cyclopterus lumpus TaxID=8103 RepID=UPI0014869A5B|nr:receptor-type tyrosine-protein phosphatase V-like isoform X6 [Cyclopterus lumpus]